MADMWVNIMVADMMASMKVDMVANMVADIEVDMVADMEVDIPKIVFLEIFFWDIKEKIACVFFLHRNGRQKNTFVWPKVI